VDIIELLVVCKENIRPILLESQGRSCRVRSEEFMNDSGAYSYRRDLKS
jgi:hypothetical protein